MNRRLRIFLIRLGVPFILIGIPAWMVYQDGRQEQTNADLIAAIKRKKTVMVRALLNRGADPNTTIKVVVVRSPWQRLLALVERMRGRHKATKSATSALMLAVSEDATDIALLLLARGAKNVDASIDVTAGNENYGTGQTVQRPLLLVAASRGNVALVRGLLDRGAHINLHDAQDMTALLLTASDLPEWYLDDPAKKADRKRAVSKHMAVCRLLLERGARPSLEDQGGATVVAAAAENDLPDMVELLLAHGAAPNIQDDSTWSALTWAGYFGELGMATALVKHGANVRHGEATGDPEVVLAAGQPGILRLLLDRGARINARDNKGQTAMHYAVKNNNVQMARLLLKRGATLNARDKSGKTPLDYAMPITDEENDGMLEMLQTVGGRR